MEAVSAICETWRREFQDTFEGLRQRSRSLSDQGQLLLQDIQIEPHREQFLSTLTATSDVQTPSKPVVETMTWGAVLVVGATLGSLASSYLLTPFLCLFLGRLGASLIAFFILPIYSQIYVRGSGEEHEGSVRFTLLAIALAEGVMEGYVFSETYLPAQPTAFLTSLAIALVFPFALKTVGKERIPLLGALLSTALAVNLAESLFTGFTFSYFLLAMLYTLGAGVTLQFIFRNVQNEEARVNVYQLAVLTSSLFAKAVVLGLLGGLQAEAETIPN